MSANYDERLAALEASVLSVTPRVRRTQQPAPTVLNTKGSERTDTYYEVTSQETLVDQQTGSVAWTTLDISSYIPPGTRYVELEIEYCISDTTSGNEDAYLRGRATSSSLVRVLARGRSSGSADNVAGAVQAKLRVSASRTFDYEIEGAFQGAADNGLAGLTMRLVGYWV